MEEERGRRGLELVPELRAEQIAAKGGQPPKQERFTRANRLQVYRVSLRDGVRLCCIGDAPASHVSFVTV